jgi:hypothetical protein
LLLYSSKPSLGVFQLAGHLLQANKLSGTIITTPSPTVGILGIGIMNSTTFLLLANSSAEFDENQEMELTIGSLNILIGPSGSSRLSDPTKQDLSTSEPETVAWMEYSEGSSSEVNSPVSLGEVQKGKIREGNETKDDIVVQLKDLTICLDDISDKSIDTWKT